MRILLQMEVVFQTPTPRRRSVISVGWLPRNAAFSRKLISQYPSLGYGSILAVSTNRVVPSFRKLLIVCLAGTSLLPHVMCV